MRFPILDNHIHLQPKGRNIEAVKDFQRMGGTHAILSHLPYGEVPIRNAEDFRDSYLITTGIAERCNQETEVRLHSTLGPYPVLLLGLSERHGLEKAKDIMMRGMEIAQQLVLDGEAIALGEIGRPHFPVSEEIWETSNEIMIYGMRLAREADCAVVIHTEHSTPEQMLEFALMADSVGLKREKVVKHYSPPLILEEENHGLFPSVLSSRPALREALEKGTRFLMETDFLDDPERPGAVMDIKTVPKRTKGLIESGLLSEEDAWKIHKDNPERVYGLEFRL
ncbi:MAG: metal-dependent hydrolase [Methanomassiliicoccales archaeon]|nr:metal-dependent hydrolase [Methanomassiliicoccales archaeon]NYT15098.1 metal-dependent hydrolase [Methanomassiliicoccales archaeon]